jgi:hypothetical protein
MELIGSRYFIKFMQIIRTGVRKVWNQRELCSLHVLHVHPDTAHCPSHFTKFVMFLLNILGWTAAQQAVILCLR